MANPYRRILAVGAIAALSLGLLAMLGPRSRGAAARLEPPTLAPFYAPPLEHVETRVLQRGETLGGLLEKAALTGSELTDLLLTLRQQRNPRLLAPGAEVTVRRWSRDGSMRAVELRLNRDSTVQLTRGASGWEGRVLLTPTKLDTVYVSGRIESGRTLYEALAEDDAIGVPPAERLQLVSDLAEIYAYKLDFAHEIQPGDAYRLVYERESRPDGTAREHRILAAEMDTKGKALRAFFYEGGGVRGGYYDEQGNSLRRGFRKYPVDYVRVTSTFAWRRYHPILGIYRAHLGTDFGARYGTPVKATADGTVVGAGQRGGYGNVVEIRHSGGYSTRYAHLSRFARGLRVGKHVAQGEVIGYVGATGLATAPHLHYELRRNGQAVDMRTAKLPLAGKLAGDVRRRFEAIVAERLPLLEAAVRRPGAQLAQRERASAVSADDEGR
ncbi:MAG: M23 family metallopeptidase [Gemmatimonadetes bacterium]|nr:M23 family metallopeptidase [Gemmatimonadota bacterium]